MSTIEPEKITKNEFNSFIDNLSNNHIIKVIKFQNKIITTITLLKEN